MAGRYPAQWLEALREKADIVSIVGSYVTLKKNGHRYVGLCPFHSETAPSFSVDEQKQVYHCFGCKAGGSVIQFIMEIEHLSFPEAVEHLAERVHMPLPQMQDDPEWERRRTLKEKIYLINKEAARIYHSWLWQPEGADILAYLKKRGLSDGIIRRFGIGAAPPGMKIAPLLTEKGFSVEEVITAGLMGRSTKDNSAYEMFRNRAVFPIIDAYGNVLAFGGRAMGDAQPKYLNTGDTPAFNKRYNVFAANLLRKSRNLSRVILVEGYMDVVTLYQYGIDGAAATLGTALTPEQAKLLKRFAPEVHLAYDGDRAGQNAILKGLDVLAGAEVPVKVLDFPDGKDPDEFLRSAGADAFNALKVLRPVEYRLIREKEKYDLSQEDGRREYAKSAAAILRDVKEPVELEDYVKQLSMTTGYTREVLMEQIGIYPKAEKRTAPVRDSFVRSRKASAQENRAATMLLAVLLTGRIPKDIVSEEDMPDDETRLLCRQIAEGMTPAQLMEDAADEQRRAHLSDIFAIQTDLDDQALRRMAQDCVRRLRREAIERQIESSNERLKHLSGAEKDRETQYQLELTKKLLALKG